MAEQRKAYPEADHEARWLSDELDTDGEVLIVETAGDIVGTVRANWFDSLATHARYEQLFELSRFSAIPAAATAVCSRLAASMEQRHSRARELLFEGIYERGISRNTSLCFATCVRPLTRLFRRYGFREYADPIHDPVVGVLHRTLLVLDDLEHLVRINSPFIRIAAEYATPNVPRAWLATLFEDYQSRRSGD